jgi:hypothetical protein
VTNALRLSDGRNRYDKEFGDHLSAVLAEVGYKHLSVRTDVYPNSNQPVTVRDYQYRIILPSGGQFGNVRRQGTQRTSAVLLEVLRRLAPGLTRRQRLRFWWYVQRNRLMGNFYYG